MAVRAILAPVRRMNRIFRAFHLIFLVPLSFYALESAKELRWYARAMEGKLSSQITADQFDKTKRLPVFQSRTKEWILDVALRLAKEEHTGVAVLVLVTTIFEPMGAIRSTRTVDKDQFADAFVYLFPNVPNGNNVGLDLYQRLRNGLFHEAFIKPGIVITPPQGEAIKLEGSSIKIDPSRFASEVAAGFERLCDEIKNTPEMQKRFDLYWEKLESNNMKPLEALFVKGKPPAPPMALSTLAPSSGTIYPKPEK